MPEEDGTATDAELEDHPDTATGDQDPQPKPGEGQDSDGSFSEDDTTGDQKPSDGDTSEDGGTEEESADDLKQRIAELEKCVSRNTKVHHENLRLKQELEAAQAKREQQAQDEPEYPEYDPRSPHYDKWANGKRKDVEAFERVINNLEGETRTQAIQQAIQRGAVSEGDLRAIHEHRRLVSDPEVIQAITDKRLESRLSEREQQQTTTQQQRAEEERLTNYFVENDKVIKKHIDDFRQAIEEGRNVEALVERWKAEEAVSSTAASKQRPPNTKNQSAAAASRDSRVAGGSDFSQVWEMACKLQEEENGSVDTTSANFLDFVDEAKAQLNS